MIELFIGFAALICNMIYRIPQIYRTYKTRSAKDISIYTIHIQNTSYILYICYGYLIGDIVYIISSIISILQNIIILFLRHKFLKEEMILNEPIKEVITS